MELRTRARVKKDARSGVWPGAMRQKPSLGTDEKNIERLSIENIFFCVILGPFLASSALPVFAFDKCVTAGKGSVH